MLPLTTNDEIGGNNDRVSAAAEADKSAAMKHRCLKGLHRARCSL